MASVTELKADTSSWSFGINLRQSCPSWRDFSEEFFQSGYVQDPGFHPQDCKKQRVTINNTFLKDTLEKKGVLGHLKARIRAEVFSALDDDHEPRPSLSHENLLINELIREYLEFNKYKYTASVLIAESGQPVVPLDRQFLIRELNAFEESKDNSIPLLYGILAHFLRGPPDGIQNVLLTESTLQPPNRHPSWKPGRKPKDDHLRKDTVPSTTTEKLHAAAQAVSR